MKKTEKVTLVENLGKSLSEATSICLVNFAGLSVAKQQLLKSKLSEVDASMIVVKNTLLKRAGEAAKIDPETLSDSVLSGQTALIITKGDSLSPIQVLGKFTKEYQVPQFKVGIVDGSFQDKDALTKLSSLPGKDALLGQLLGSLLSPSYGLVGVLNGNLQKLVYILDQKSKMTN